MTEPWKTDKYFVSPLNYLPEVTATYHLPAKVKIHDITLRDGEQETGIALKKDEKVAIAEALAEAGVHRIEAGMPAVSKQDEGAIREMVKRNLVPRSSRSAAASSMTSAWRPTVVCPAPSWRSPQASTLSSTAISGRWQRRSRPRWMPRAWPTSWASTPSSSPSTPPARTSTR